MLQKLLAGSDYEEEAASSRAQDQGILGDSVHAVCQQEGLKHTPKDLADDTAQCHDQLPRSPATEQKPLTGMPDASSMSQLGLPPYTRQTLPGMSSWHGRPGVREGWPLSYQGEEVRQHEQS